jgi:hypothetical protein
MQFKALSMALFIFFHIIIIYIKFLFLDKLKIFAAFKTDNGIYFFLIFYNVIRRHNALKTIHHYKTLNSGREKLLDSIKFDFKASLNYVYDKKMLRVIFRF